MNPTQPHHLVYSGPQYYSQQHPGPGDSPSARQDTFSNRNPPYSNPSAQGRPSIGLPEQPDPVRVQSRSSNFFPSYGGPTEARPFDPPHAHHTTPLGIDTDFRSGRYTTQGPPIAASRPSISGWHDGHRYSAEGEPLNCS